MRRSQRLIAASVLIALSGAVAGCSSSISSWDPMDMLDLLDTKKKLPGERKPVFPDGVPGLEQGVPKSLYKGASATGDRSAERPGRSGRCRRRLPRTPSRSASPNPRASNPRPPTRTPPPRLKRTARRQRRRRPSRRRSSASAPPRRRPISRPTRNPPRNRPSRRNNPLRHSRRRCRAVRSSADFGLPSHLYCARP